MNMMMKAVGNLGNKMGDYLAMKTLGFKPSPRSPEHRPFLLTPRLECNIMENLKTRLSMNDRRAVTRFCSNGLTGDKCDGDRFSCLRQMDPVLASRRRVQVFNRILDLLPVGKTPRRKYNHGDAEC